MTVKLKSAVGYLVRILTVLMIVGLIGMGTGCFGNKEEIKEDIPTYRADQVIAVAQGYSPTFSIYEQQNYISLQEPAWSAEYLSQGVWMVKKWSVNRYNGQKTYREGWYFHEKTGKLDKSRY